MGLGFGAFLRCGGGLRDGERDGVLVSSDSAGLLGDVYIRAIFPLQRFFHNLIDEQRYLALSIVGIMSFTEND